MSQPGSKYCAVTRPLCGKPSSILESIAAASCTGIVGDANTYPPPIIGCNRRQGEIIKSLAAPDLHEGVAPKLRSWKPHTNGRVGRRRDKAKWHIAPILPQRRFGLRHSRTHLSVGRCPGPAKTSPPHTAGCPRLRSRPPRKLQIRPFPSPSPGIGPRGANPKLLASGSLISPGR